MVVLTMNSTCASLSLAVPETGLSDQGKPVFGNHGAF